MNREGEGEDTASVGPMWQREKGWGLAVSSRKEGGEGVRARLGREGSGPGKKRGELCLGGALGRNEKLTAYSRRRSIRAEKKEGVLAAVEIGCGHGEIQKLKVWGG